MIVITGATGNTGSKTADLLLEKGEKIRVIGRSEERLKAFHDRGAEIMAGDQGNAAFLTEALSEADIVYLLIPPKVDAENVRDYYNTMGDVAVSAIGNSGTGKVVFLSSQGAELESGTGPVIGLHDVEQKLSILKDVDIATLRPALFMENTMMNIPLIKKEHINGGTIAPDTPIPMIATKDIAVKAVELLLHRNFTGHIIVDLFGDIVSYGSVTRLISESIGYGEIPYIRFSDGDAIDSMKKMGLSVAVAGSLVELWHALDEGKVRATTVDPAKPNTPTRFESFVKEVFAPAFHSFA